MLEGRSRSDCPASPVAGVAGVTREREWAVKGRRVPVQGEPRHAAVVPRPALDDRVIGTPRKADVLLSSCQGDHEARLLAGVLSVGDFELPVDVASVKAGPGWVERLPRHDAARSCAIARSRSMSRDESTTAPSDSSSMTAGGGIRVRRRRAWSLTMASSQPGGDLDGRRVRCRCTFLPGHVPTSDHRTAHGRLTPPRRRQV